MARGHHYHHVADSKDLQNLLAMNGRSKGLNKAIGRGGQTIATRSVLFLTLATAFLFGYVSIWRVHTRVIPARSTERRSGDDAPYLDESRGRKTDDDSALESIKGIFSDTLESLLPKSTSNPQPKLQLSTKRNRVYCFVPFIWTPSALKAYHAIEATWGKRCDTLRFFIDPIIGDEKVGFYNMTEPSGVVAARETANLTLPDDVVILHSISRPWHVCSGGNMKQFGNCRNIFEKIWRTWVYVARGTGGSHVGGGADDGAGSDAFRAEWFVKIDSDTWFFPENVDHYVTSRNWTHDEQHYFGHVLNHRKGDRGVSIVAGAAVFFSRATVLTAAEAFEKMPLDKGHLEEDGTCRDSYTGTEEVVTAVCLKTQAGVVAEPAIDSQGREEVSLYEIWDILSYNRTDQGEWWFWQDKTRFPCHDDGDCLAHLPLAFHHYKDPSWFYDFELEFYPKENDRKPYRSRNGKVAARKWPYLDERVYPYFERIRAAMKARDLSVPVESSSPKATIDLRVADTRDLSVPVESSSPKATIDLRVADRLYCMVPFLWSPEHKKAYYTIKDTWGQRCDVLKFFIDPIVKTTTSGYIDLREEGKSRVFKVPTDVVVVKEMMRPWNTCGGGSDGTCRNIWEKIWRSWVLVDSSGDVDTAEWFVKIDADSYLFPDNVKHYIRTKGWSPDDHHYFGHVLRHEQVYNNPIVAGGGVFFSRATVKSSAEIFRTFDAMENNHARCKDEHTDREEVLTANCLKEHFGVDAHEALDDQGQELITVAEIEDALLWNRTEQGEWWYWQNKPKTHPETGREMHLCCGDLPFVFHGYKDPQWFYQLEFEFYPTRASARKTLSQYTWRNSKKTQEYFTRVRKAMQDMT